MLEQNEIKSTNNKPNGFQAPTPKDYKLEVPHPQKTYHSRVYLWFAILLVLLVCVGLVYLTGKSSVDDAKKKQAWVKSVPLIADQKVESERIAFATGGGNKTSIPDISEVRTTKNNTVPEYLKLLVLPDAKDITMEELKFSNNAVGVRLNYTTSLAFEDARLALVKAMEKKKIKIFTWDPATEVAVMEYEDQGYANRVNIFKKNNSVLIAVESKTK